jgi:alkylated DNA nucleotide flippase Atl1
MALQEILPPVGETGYRETMGTPTRDRCLALDASSPFVRHVLAIVESIPPGRVMTYGGVAAQLGSRGARRVGQIMARYGSNLPWWRVIRATGHPPTCHEGHALEHYRTEHTPLVRHADPAYRVDLARACWWP